MGKSLADFSDNKKQFFAIDKKKSQESQMIYLDVHGKYGEC
jgi:hypothetical protein